MPEEDFPFMPLNDLGYEIPGGMVDMDDPIALSDFLESMLEKSQ